MSMGTIFAAGQILFTQSGAKRYTAMVVRGLLKSSSLTPDGGEVTLRLHGPGEVAGLPSETCQVIALRDTVIRPVDLLPATIRMLTEQRLAAMERRLTDAFTRSVPERLADMIAEMSDQLRTPIVPLSQSELALMVGTTPFSVNRIVMHWQRLGIVKTVSLSSGHRGGNFKCVQLLDRDALQNPRVVINSNGAVTAQREA